MATCSSQMGKPRQSRSRTGETCGESLFGFQRSLCLVRDPGHPSAVCVGPSAGQEGEPHALRGLWLSALPRWGRCLGVALFQGSLRPQVSCPERQRSTRGSVPEDSPGKASRQEPRP